jgi:hypothetical protein
MATDAWGAGGKFWGSNEAGLDIGSVLNTKQGPGRAAWACGALQPF